MLINVGREADFRGVSFEGEGPVSLVIVCFLILVLVFVLDVICWVFIGLGWLWIFCCVLAFTIDVTVSMFTAG